uniref:Uncharacterized protein n=1 Tax=Setaria viridis TaxID=4556 RepID=A0A4U6W5T1_SETVI|nr:hypothetical protein SEVIR_1G082301v2 [Setaria viridis]
MQKEEGICPVKLLLLALSMTRPLVFSHMVDGNFPVSWLLEMFNSCSGMSDADDLRSFRAPLRRLLLTSRTTMLLEDISSVGRLPVKKLLDRLRRSRLLRSPRDDYAFPGAAACAVPP